MTRSEVEQILRLLQNLGLAPRLTPTANRWRILIELPKDTPNAFG